MGGAELATGDPCKIRS